MSDQGQESGQDMAIGKLQTERQGMLKKESEVKLEVEQVKGYNAD